MTHPDEDHTSLHGKIGAFFTGTKKNNDLFLSGLSCRLVEHRTVFSAGASSACQGLLCSTETSEIF